MYARMGGVLGGRLKPLLNSSASAPENLDKPIQMQPNLGKVMQPPPQKRSGSHRAQNARMHTLKALEGSFQKQGAPNLDPEKQDP